MNHGWNESAAAWIADQGDTGDYGRRHVLDAPMLARAELLIAQAPGRALDALDIGCGEGRFSRMLAARGVRTVGIDPVEELIAAAKARHADGDYRVDSGEALPFADASFDLAVHYLTLIDIPDFHAAIAETARVLRPGGSILIANLTSFRTAETPESVAAGTGFPVTIDNYLEDGERWSEWRGIRVISRHRPLCTYMSLLLAEQLQLRYFDEPQPGQEASQENARFHCVPYFLIMEWRKPALSDA